MSSPRKYCPKCGQYWRSSAVFSNEAVRTEEYFCVNGHRWTGILRFTGYASDGTRCYTAAPDVQPVPKSRTAQGET